MQRRPEVGKIYRHYKGHEYLVLGFAFDSESEQEMVIYTRYHDSRTRMPNWVRPLAMWFEVIKPETPNIQALERFTPVERSAVARQSRWQTT